MENDVLIKHGQIESVVASPLEEEDLARNYNHNLQEGSQGQSCSEFYRLSGITLRKQELLSRIRDGEGRVTSDIPIMMIYVYVGGFFLNIVAKTYHVHGGEYYHSRQT